MEPSAPEGAAPLKDTVRNFKPSFVPLSMMGTAKNLPVSPLVKVSVPLVA